MIQWEEKYATGVAKVDDQHKWLFDFANSLEEQLRDESQKTDFDHILNSMKEYAQRHFHYEEDCMNKWKCPVAAENKKAHEQFIWAYENFMERLNREGYSDALAWKIHNMVEKWITNHICQIDIHLRNCKKTVEK